MSKYSPRELHQLDFVSQFTSTIEHIPAQDSTVVYTLSRISLHHLDKGVFYFDTTTKEQNFDKTDLPMQGTSLQLTKLPATFSEKMILCDTSFKNPRPYIPSKLRKTIFQHFHGMSHSSIRATVELITQRFLCITTTDIWDQVFVYPASVIKSGDTLSLP